MNAKEYLSQVYTLEQIIKSNVDQIESLNEMATKYTSFLSFTPGGTNKSNSRMEDTVARIVDMKEELDAEINKLYDLRDEIVAVIKSVENLEYRSILAYRYLCNMKWKSIADRMHYGITWTKKLHERALNVVDRLLEKKCDRK